MHPISDVVLSAGVERLSALDRSNLSVARKLQNFSMSHPLDGDAAPAAEAAAKVAPAPDMGADLVLLTRNALSYSMVSRALSAQLGLYSAVISEGRG